MIRSFITCTPRPNVITVIQSRGLRWEEHEREVMSPQKVIVRNPERNIPYGRPRGRWRIILAWILKRESGILQTGFLWLRLRTSDWCL
jgi:hypothetical protein